VLARVRSVLRSREDIDRRIERERELVAAARKLEASNQQLLRLSAVDALTGIANRRCFDQTVYRVWRSAARREHSVALIMIDIDFFKPYNDHFGHQAGDECLRNVAQSVAAGLKRPDDFVARYGGEEFGVVLPETDIAGATVVAERLRRGVESLTIPHPASPGAKHITISQGVTATVPARESPPSRLIALADEALYQAKKTGRNKVCSPHVSAKPLLSGFVARQSHNRTPGWPKLGWLPVKPQ
jgi:diguanylate cyclase (GGDEF)-like protein